MADARTRTEDWNTLPWKDIQRNVFRLQRRIYRAARRGDVKRVHSLQRLLLCSWSARCLAVRRVTQDNRGKRTPGVDGVASLTPHQRMQMVAQLRNLATHTPAPLRRMYIPKPGKQERRGLAVPTMLDRALQTLVKLALEPEWEARFEPNSYGFRPGRSPHDAIEAVFNFIRLKPKYVFDADITKCFDNISHDVILDRLHAIRPVARLARGWLKTGILDHGEYIFPEAGTAQGGPLSPLLANVALHGLETALCKAAPSKAPPGVIRFADDFVILHHDLETLKRLVGVAQEWLAGIGLELNHEKTRITHTLEPHEGMVGFDFLGFHVRQYPKGKHRTPTYRGVPGFKTLIKPSRQALQRHRDQMRQVIQQHQGAPQAAMVHLLNPIIQGWANCFQHCVAKRDFQILDNVLYHQLTRWARYRHPRKSGKWCYYRYWRKVNGRVRFSDGQSVLSFHQTTTVSRHVKVQSDKSPFDGDWVYWSTWLGRDPAKPRRVTRLLKQQRGHCAHCGLRFMAEDVMEVHHRDSNHTNNRRENLALLHGHCHDAVHGTRCQ
jgi:RNA-directed DNA polymerase